MPHRKGAAKDSSSTLTAAEAEVMNLIWAHEPISMPDIVERLPRSLAYSTVMTTVRILEEKGFIVQAGKKGRAFIYRARAKQDEVRGSMARDLAHRLFGGCMKSMVMNLIQDRDLGEKDLDELKQMIQKMESKK